MAQGPHHTPVGERGGARGSARGARGGAGGGERGRATRGSRVRVRGSGARSDARRGHAGANERGARVSGSGAPGRHALRQRGHVSSSSCTAPPRTDLARPFAHAGCGPAVDRSWPGPAKSAADPAVDPAVDPAPWTRPLGVGLADRGVAGPCGLGVTAPWTGPAWPVLGPAVAPSCPGPADRAPCGGHGPGPGTVDPVVGPGAVDRPVLFVRLVPAVVTGCRRTARHPTDTRARLSASPATLWTHPLVWTLGSV